MNYNIYDDDSDDSDDTINSDDSFAVFSDTETNITPRESLNDNLFKIKAILSEKCKTFTFGLVYDNLLLGCMVRYIKYSFSFKGIDEYWAFLSDQFLHVCNSSNNYGGEVNALDIAVRFLQLRSKLQNSNSVNAEPVISDKFRILMENMDKLKITNRFISDTIDWCYLALISKTASSSEENTSNGSGKFAAQKDDLDVFLEDFKSVLQNSKWKLENVIKQNAPTPSIQEFDQKLEAFITYTSSFDPKARDKKFDDSVTSLLNSLDGIEKFSNKGKKETRANRPKSKSPKARSPRYSKSPKSAKSPKSSKYAKKNKPSSSNTNAVAPRQSGQQQQQQIQQQNISSRVNDIEVHYQSPDSQMSTHTDQQTHYHQPSPFTHYTPTPVEQQQLASMGDTLMLIGDNLNSLSQNQDEFDIDSFINSGGLPQQSNF